MNGSAVGADRVRQVLLQLMKVGDMHRQYTVPASAAGMYGIGPDDLDAWTALGLSVHRTGAGSFYDPDDLYNLSLHLGLPSLHKLAMRSWSAALRASEHDRSWTLSYSLTAGPVTVQPVDVLTPGGRERMKLASEKDFFRTAGHAAGRRQHLPPPVAALIEQAMRDVRFYMLHDPIRWNSPFILRHGLTECGGFSKLLVELAQVEGFEARQVFGLILSRPYATGHYWSQFRVDGQWVAADPLMIRLLRQHAALPADDWPEHRSPAGALLPLAVVDGYDSVGAPLLDALPTKRFMQHPVVTCGTSSYPTSYTVTD